MIVKLLLLAILAVCYYLLVLVKRREQGDCRLYWFLPIWWHPVAWVVGAVNVTRLMNWLYSRFGLNI